MYLPLRTELLVKIVILCLAITCFGLHYNSMVEGGMNTRLLLDGTFVSFVIIQVATILAECLGKIFDKRIEILFVLLGAVMFIASGVISIDHFVEVSVALSADKLALTKGICAVLNGFLFTVSAVFAFMEYCG